MKLCNFIGFLILWAIFALPAVLAQNIPTSLTEVYDGSEIEILTGDNSEQFLQGNWSAGSNMPNARYYGGSVVFTRNDTSWLYVLGGDTTGGGVATATCLKYNINTDTWKYIAPMPEPLRTNAAVLIGEKIYTMGGFNAPFPAPAVTSFYEYDINTDSWTTLPDIPSPLFFHGAIGFQDSLIYIIGGIEDIPDQDGDLWSVRVRLYNINDQTFRDATDLPEATASFGSSLISSTFFLTAGLKSTTELWNHTQIGEIDQNDRATINYSFGTNYPLSVYAHYGVQFPDDEIYYAGGSNTTGFSPVNNVYEYDANMDSYKPGLDLPVSGMAYFAGVNYSPEMQDVPTEIKLVIAGGIVAGPSLSNQCWIFTDTVDVVGVNKIEGTAPNEFSLLQNYPNPFNPATTIQFALPQSSAVNLEVYNSLGEKIAVLISEDLSAGTYKYNWNAEGLPSGIYFYKLTTQNLTESKKMILLK